MRLFLVLFFAIFALGVGNAPPTALGHDATQIPDLVDRVRAAVVNISTRSADAEDSKKGVPLPSVPKGSPFEDFFDEFFKRQQEKAQKEKGADATKTVTSLGSGFVIDASGIIVTSQHVVSGVSEIFVSFADGTKLPATIIGEDDKTDIALLKVDAQRPLSVLKFGESSKLRVGQTVVAIGNPFGLGGTVTSGIISALNRDINSGPYDSYIQTDAAINRGDTGGPLFNLDGEVIGINTAIISPTGGSIGIGFAVPSHLAARVIEQLKKFGATRRGWLGVRIQSITDEIAGALGLDKPTGALVASVTAGSPAAKAGIVAGDVILRFGGAEVETMRALPRIVARTPVGDTVEVQVLRKGSKRSLKVTIGRLPESPAKEPFKKQKEGRASESTAIAGLTVGILSDAARSGHGIAKDIDGVIITKVEPGSIAAEKSLKAGDVIVEITQEKVNTPDDFSAKVAKVRKAGRNSVLLLVSDDKGQLRFVALPVTDAGQ